MSPDIELGIVARRIGSLTNIIRTRAEDVARAERHNGSNGESAERAREIVTRLKVVVEQLEKAIA